jgi:GGDEF domain-containing protein
MAARIRAAFAEPVAVDGRLLPIAASIGVATGCVDEYDSLLRQADAAMYEVKRSAKAPAQRHHQPA